MPHSEKLYPLKKGIFAFVEKISLLFLERKIIFADKLYRKVNCVKTFKPWRKPMENKNKCFDLVPYNIPNNPYDFLNEPGFLYFRWTFEIFRGNLQK